MADRGGRAWRRAMAQRAKARAVRRLKATRLPLSGRWVGRSAATPAPCSCWMCRSPRYSFKTDEWRLPMQERRALAAADALP